MNPEEVIEVSERQELKMTCCLVHFDLLQSVLVINSRLCSKLYDIRLSGCSIRCFQYLEAIQSKQNYILCKTSVYVDAMNAN